MAKKPRPAQKKSRVTKLFVLDTNVLMHDPSCLFRFEEHDVYLPIGTLEELDNHKKGLSDVARNARQASRFLDEIVSDSVADIKAGLPIRTRDGKASGGRLYLQTEAINGELPRTFAAGKTDNQILSVCACRSSAAPGSSRDINMHQPRALGLPPRTTSTTRCWRTPTSSTPACARCRRISGTATAATWSRGRRKATPTTACAARWCRGCC
jgi:PhoH-like ATPase